MSASRARIQKSSEPTGKLSSSMLVRRLSESRTAIEGRRGPSRRFLAQAPAPMVSETVRVSPKAFRRPTRFWTHTNQDRHVTYISVANQTLITAVKRRINGWIALHRYVSGDDDCLSAENVKSEQKQGPDAGEIEQRKLEAWTRLLDTDRKLAQMPGNTKQNPQACNDENWK